MRCCKHRATSWVSRRQVGPDLWVTELQCLSCMRPLPLGQATDTPEVAIEVRAAEIAASREPDDTITCFIVEGFGYDRVDVKNPDADWHAGYLARCISDHDGADR